MSGANILLLATLDTKRTEVQYLVDRLTEYGCPCEVIDTTLDTGGDKVAAMHGAATSARRAISARIEAGARIVAGIGGGTGAQIITEAIAELPFALPKVLITTMAADPRPDTADNSIILIPSVSDLMGLNPTTRQVLQNAAAVLAGLARYGVVHPHISAAPTVGITALGVTGAAAEHANTGLRDAGHETTVFHANGYGGEAFCRWAACGAFLGVIDLTIHELNRFFFGGRNTVPKNRFTAATEAGLAQVVLPGAVNFFTRGPLSVLSEDDRARAHYSHSPQFTHLALTTDEMVRAGMFLGGELAKAHTPTILILPMGGFSSEDRPGGVIEAPEGRTAFADACVKTAGTGIDVIELADTHINNPVCAKAAIDALVPHLPKEAP